MNRYREGYKGRRVSIEEAPDKLKTGDAIGVSQCANVPTVIFDAMHTLHGRTELRKQAEE